MHSFTFLEIVGLFVDLFREPSPLTPLAPIPTHTPPPNMFSEHREFFSVGDNEED